MKKSKKIKGDNCYDTNLSETSSLSSISSTSRVDTANSDSRHNIPNSLTNNCSSNDNVFALKSISKKKIMYNCSADQNIALKEIEILEKIEFPFIVKYLFSFENDSKIFIGEEFIPGGSLFDRLTQSSAIPLNQVQLYIAEITLALEYLHKKGIVYRDLKPENVLLDRDGHIKLSDFGLSKTISKKCRGETFCGTAEYIAPEIVKHQQYGVEIDWWELGILTFELLFGKVPFENENRLRLYTSIVNDHQIYPDNVPDEISSFINMLLQKDPINRGNFCGIVSHRFFKNISFNDVLEKKIVPEFIPLEKNYSNSPIYDKSVSPEAGKGLACSEPNQKVPLNAFFDFSESNDLSQGYSY
ncbi:Serine/threonine-protein kinase Sgk1 [Tritrichomonas foetus]|uniref:Serine/threonine-protein kinase Sgk1 n=1 Tax=Tritrichomonas foetus TaxID=1144522 RepID=A0A1J4KJ33_9EUKA|nr:Serine/threonine-protein kinase Sgk1 [Tritrichomonas foetus]|eukprot:OHT11353.1 Serine/threonine-protein kinase Sgk1 [Tritrichomonas foetus]